MSAVNLNKSDLDPNQEDKPSFEGPEKRLEVNYYENLENSPEGLRKISQETWQDLLDLAKCMIISKSSTDYVDSYVLSESSLFVFKNKVILKTCGTTTLLHCLEKLEELAESCSLRPKSVLYSRKNFNFPDQQLFPHKTFSDEVAILNKKFTGAGHILGPVQSGADHHFVYFWQDGMSFPDRLLSKNGLSNERSRPDFDGVTSEVGETPSAQTLELLMSQLDSESMAHFFRAHETFVDAKTTTRQVGLASLLPEMITDEHMFDPCGYSVNGISHKDDSYFTVHVTPEPACSFVSFEMQHECSPSFQQSLINNVLTFFRPGRFSLVISSQEPLPFLPKDFLDGYSCKFSHVFGLEGFSVLMMNFIKA